MFSPLQQHAQATLPRGAVADSLLLRCLATPGGCFRSQQQEHPARVRTGQSCGAKRWGVRARGWVAPPSRTRALHAMHPGQNPNQQPSGPLLPLGLQHARTIFPPRAQVHGQPPCQNAFPVDVPGSQQQAHHAQIEGLPSSLLQSPRLVTNGPATHLPFLAFRHVRLWHPAAPAASSRSQFLVHRAHARALKSFVSLSPRRVPSGPAVLLPFDARHCCWAAQLHVHPAQTRAPRFSLSLCLQPATSGRAVHLPFAEHHPVRPCCRAVPAAGLHAQLPVLLTSLPHFCQHMLSPGGSRYQLQTSRTLLQVLKFSRPRAPPLH
mmetsp:Transcript_34784/g.92879  ORF Transcript_34784/g.92879 Transcript_34784/m.92879 type:complete len:321 (-) Transcript_34784:520-1482(-)